VFDAEWHEIATDVSPVKACHDAEVIGIDFDPLQLARFEDVAHAWAVRFRNRQRL
jgi:hypothetical protein